MLAKGEAVVFCFFRKSTNNNPNNKIYFLQLITVIYQTLALYDLHLAQISCISNCQQTTPWIVPFMLLYDISFGYLNNYNQNSYLRIIYSNLNFVKMGKFNVPLTCHKIEFLSLKLKVFLFLFPSLNLYHFFGKVFFFSLSN